MSACTKHAAEPVRGYRDCPGCEVESLRQQLAAAQAEARELRAELAWERELPARWRAAPQNPDEPLTGNGKPDLLLINLRTIGTHHCDQTVGEEAAQEIERLREANAEIQKQMARAWNDGFDFAMKGCGWQEGEDPNNGERTMRTCTIHDERPNTNGNTFAVMLLPVPSLPEGMEAASGEMVMQAVIGATDHELGEGKAGWVVLSSEEKDAIGCALHEHGAEVHRWYWCQLWEQDDSVQETHAVVP